MQTTLYNHVNIGSTDKPLIPNIIFKSLLYLIEVKDHQAYEYILSNYSLAPDQKSYIDYLINLNK